MKKRPILLLSLFLGVIFNLLFSVKSHALSTDENGTTWYTVAELLEYKEQIDTEEREECSGDTGCLKNYRENKKNSDEKYAALATLEPWQIMLTSINLKSGTVKLVVFDEDMRTKYFSGVEKRGLEIKSLYFAWFDDAKAADQFSNAIRTPEKLLNDEIPDIHPILGFAGAEALTIEKNKEIEFEIVNSDNNITKNSSGYYEYKAKTNFFNKSAHISYSNCLKAEQYPNGKCDLTVSNGKMEYVFIPEPDEEPIINTLEPNDEVNIEEEKSTMDSLEYFENNSNSIEEGTVLIKAPDTGSFTNTCEKIIEFPWWLGILIIIGNLTCLWLFYPKKGIDKKKKVR